jgi:ATP/maltotriose-dependent transcriptional regulator MalT
MLWIEAAPWWTANVRSMAALNLGFIALTQQRLDDAAHWYNRANRGRDRALACTGLALVRALQGDSDEAERQLTRAGKSGEGRHAQAEIDGVRLLVALRRDGAEEAARLGDRLRNPNSGGLFLGLLACAHARQGNEASAKEVLEEHAAREMIDSVFGDVVPELRELKWVGDVG